ncbi:hypothetical protein H1Q78_13610 [Cellulosimicrobium cellulans]|uniref:FGGY-family carbohydrate kinase n=1 Tax=Cellulosimicrobium cellulans TaxID=1710 RepID=UPI001EDAC466|nr:FGGY family carbohydrate kinase [Cellulosimicrobium cellulans]UKJ62773.1 hypothetical protein H1Q78_13610 [Cellulosimicrobium cellulans]
MSYLGIDLGTTGTRVGVYDEGGNELVARSRRTTVVRPAPGRAHVDAEAVLDGVEALVRDVVAEPAVVADPVEALSFSTLGEAVVPVDRTGRALGPAPLSMDGRGAGSADRLRQLLGGEAVQEITGQPLHPMFSVHKVRGLLPDGALPAAVRTLDDFVATRLGAAPAVDLTMASRTGAFDVRTCAWSDAVLDALDVPAALLSPVVAAGDVIGAVSADAAARTGLRAGTPVVAGVHDQAAAFLGGGGRPGLRAVFSFGSSDCLTVGTRARPERLGGTGLATYPVGADLWVTLAGTAAGGFALDWFSSIVHHDRIDPWASLYEVGAVDPPPLLVAPYLAGSGTLDNDPAARGALLGLTLETTTAQIARAFVEASGFELAKIRAALAERGVEPVDVHAVGGGSVNLGALQARSDAAGVPLRAVVREAAGRGAALLAALGAGTFASVLDLPAPPVVHEASPDPRHAAWYARQRATFDSLHRLLTPVSTSLAVEHLDGTALKEIA